MITEEFVTNNVARWLRLGGWRVVAVDFPQAGTGVMLHPQPSGSPNQGALIPDIIAVLGSRVVLVESKDRFVRADFRKVHDARVGTGLLDAVRHVLGGQAVDRVTYGAAMPDIESQYSKTRPYLAEVDFVWLVSAMGNVRVLYSSDGVDVD